MSFKPKHSLLVGAIALPAILFAAIMSIWYSNLVVYSIYFFFASVALASLALIAEKREKQLKEEIEHRDIIERQLRQAQKMELIGQLSSGMMHDFRNMLSMVILNLERLQNTMQDNIYVNQAFDAAVRASNAISSTLNFAKSKNTNRIDMSAILNEMALLLHQACGSKITLKIDSSPSPIITLDRSQLELAILNLVLNARDAMPEGGILRISSQLVHLDQIDLRGRFVALTIQDNGDGISAEAIDKIFVPFFTTKARGTGLGLSIVNNFVNQAGGKIDVTSSPDTGTTITLYFPVKESYVRSNELNHQK